MTEAGAEAPRDQVHLRRPSPSGPRREGIPGEILAGGCAVLSRKGMEEQAEKQWGDPTPSPHPAWGIESL